MSTDASFDYYESDSDDSTISPSVPKCSLKCIFGYMETRTEFTAPVLTASGRFALWSHQYLFQHYHFDIIDLPFRMRMQDLHPIQSTTKWVAVYDDLSAVFLVKGRMMNCQLTTALGERHTTWDGPAAEPICAAFPLDDCGWQFLTEHFDAETQTSYLRIYTQMQHQSPWSHRTVPLRGENVESAKLSNNILWICTKKLLWRVDLSTNKCSRLPVFEALTRMEKGNGNETRPLNQILLDENHVCCLTKTPLEGRYRIAIIQFHDDLTFKLVAERILSIPFEFITSVQSVLYGGHQIYAVLSTVPRDREEGNIEENKFTHLGGRRPRPLYLMANMAAIKSGNDSELPLNALKSLRITHN